MSFARSRADWLSDDRIILTQVSTKILGGCVVTDEVILLAFLFTMTTYDDKARLSFKYQTIKTKKLIVFHAFFHTKHWPQQRSKNNTSKRPTSAP